MIQKTAGMTRLINYLIYDNNDDDDTAPCCVKFGLIEDEYVEQWQ